MFDKAQIQSIYRKRAPRYDLSANLFHLIGFREQHYRRRAVAALNLQSGDTVVEVGCGTGLNFGLLEKAIGPKGRIIGVDMSAQMLARARKRVKRRGWSNVQLVEEDATGYRFPRRIDGMLSTFAITLVPEYSEVIDHAAAALGHDKRMVVLDFRLPNWPRPMVGLMARMIRPFAGSLDMAERHPWEAMKRRLEHVTMDNLYFGSAYLAVGRK